MVPMLLGEAAGDYHPSLLMAALPGPVRDTLQRFQLLQRGTAQQSASPFASSATAPSADGHLHVPSESLETDTLSVAALVQVWIRCGVSHVVLIFAFHSWLLRPCFFCIPVFQALEEKLTEDDVAAAATAAAATVATAPEEVRNPTSEVDSPGNPSSSMVPSQPTLTASESRADFEATEVELIVR
jgi:hypothetical protein